MAKVMFLLSKKKDQMQEYKKLKNDNFDAKVKKIEDKREKFNKKIDNRISRLEN